MCYLKDHKFIKYRKRWKNLDALDLRTLIIVKN